MGNQRAVCVRRQFAVSATISMSVENDTVEQVSEFFHAAE